MTSNITGPEPRLGPLADNGGPTWTHALLPVSPAIDAGSCIGLDNGPMNLDQRGAPRPQGQGCDMGAYDAAPEVSGLTNAQKASQTITIVTHTPASATYGASFTVTATGGSSGNPVTYGASGMCSHVGPTFTMTSGAGTCTVHYNQAGNADHDPAPEVTQNVAAQKASQIITVVTHAPASATYSASFTVAATGGGSGNPVTYASSGACTNAAALFTMTSGAGACTVHYNQAGNADYNPAPEVTETVDARPRNIYLPFIRG